MKATAWIMGYVEKFNFTGMSLGGGHMEDSAGKVDWGYI